MAESPSIAGSQVLTYHIFFFATCRPFAHDSLPQEPKTMRNRTNGDSFRTSDVVVGVGVVVLIKLNSARASA
jgi:hypothetical protein